MASNLQARRNINGQGLKELGVISKRAKNDTKLTTLEENQPAHV
jgi:hypothetical protein